MRCSSAFEAVDFILARQLIPSTFVDELGNDLSRFESGEAVINELVRSGHLTDYQQSKLLAGDGDKLCFGPYRLVKPLGEGGMGEVFKAWQPRLDRFVALKFISSECMDDRSTAIARFQREAHAIAKLQHANIIVLYDAAEIDGVPYIAMEFVDGMSLTDLVCKNGSLTIRQACEYMRQTALGLQHAHECGFVHRDIKPSNIVVFQAKTKDIPTPLPSPSPSLPKKLSLITMHDVKRKAEESALSLERIKILDMGLARLNDSLSNKDRVATALTEAGALLGTPDYLAPEQARNASAVDIRADLYSLGCTFYYVLSGQPPFPGGTPLEKMIKHQCDEPTPLRTLRRTLPESVARIVEKLMSKRPDDRFQKPVDLANALSKYLANAAAEPELPPPQSRSASGTKPTLIVPQQGPDSKQTVDTIDSPLSTNDESIVLPPGSIPGLWETMASLHSADFSEVDINDLNWESVGEYNAKRIRKGKIKPIARIGGHVGAVSGVAVTGDGRLAATADVNGQLRIWDLDEANPRTIERKQRGGEIQAILLAPNALDSVVFGELRQGKIAVVRWNWKSDSLVELGDLTSLGQKGFGSLSFSPDGELLAAGIGTLAVTWKMAKGAATNRTIHKGMDRPIRALAISPDRRLLAAAGQDKSLNFWHLGIGKWTSNGVRVKSQITTITCMRYSPDGTVLAMAGIDNKIVLWPMAGESEAVRILHGHLTNVQHIQFIGGGSQLASVGMDGEILYWDLRKGSIVRKRHLDLALAYRMELSEDGTRLVAGFTNGTVGIYCPAAPL